MSFTIWASLQRWMNWYLYKAAHWKKTVKPVVRRDWCKIEFQLKPKPSLFRKRDCFVRLRKVVVLCLQEKDFIPLTQTPYQRWRLLGSPIKNNKFV